MDTKEQIIDELIRQNKYLTDLYQSALYLIQNSFPDLYDSLNEIVQRAGQLVGTHHSFLGLVDLNIAEAERRIDYTTGTGIFSQQTKEFELLTQEVWSIGKTVIITDFRGHFSEIDLCTSVQVAIGIPLVYKLELLGILGVIYDVESGRTNFDDDEIKLLSGYAELVSLMIYNSHTHRESFGELLKRIKECEDQDK